MVQVKFLNITTTYTDICKIRGYTSIDWQYRIRIQNASSKVKESCYHFTIYVIVVLGEDCNTEIKEKKILFFFSQQSFSCNILHIQASTAPQLPNTCCVEMD